ncbi:hypothetical protein L2E82_05561 [Cichorium intybus]|uniref:Uncharacterized protein n=1 Tax=Cichorium intybus TaxID=13427 RepID=A0ACB9H7I1_CICIN|nr:hypothetical protein L2E82_05561 [Cichorium intybus]
MTDVHIYFTTKNTRRIEGKNRRIQVFITLQHRIKQLRNLMLPGLHGPLRISPVKPIKRCILMFLSAQGLKSSNSFATESIDTTDVIARVATLFDDHPDLLEEFTRFLPDVSTAASAHQASFLRQSYNRRDERSSNMAPLRRTILDKIIPSNGERDPCVEGVKMEDDKTMIKPNEGQRKRCEKDRRNRDQDFKEPEIDANRDINHLEKRKSARKCNPGGLLDEAIDVEDKQHQDFLRLNHVEGYHELSSKTQIYFSTATAKWDADFYIKLDDDVHINLRLYDWLDGAPSSFQTSRLYRLHDVGTGSCTKVRVDHMAIALSKAYKSPIVDTIQSLPQHQQQ